MQTMVKYTFDANPYDQVLVKSDDSFVILGETTPSDGELQAMVDWEEIEGWTAY